MTTSSPSGAIEALTFDLHGETFGLEAGLVREVLDLLPETDVPGAPAFAGAVINFRGRVIPLVDLRLAFGLERAEPTTHSRIVVIEFDVNDQPTLIGLRTDRVHEVTTIDYADTELPPRVGMRWRQDFIRCLAKRSDDLIIVPDLARIFAARGRTSPQPSLQTTAQS